MDDKKSLYHKMENYTSTAWCYKGTNSIKTCKARNSTLLIVYTCTKIFQFDCERTPF